MRDSGWRLTRFFLAFMVGGVCSQAEEQQARDASGRRTRDLDNQRVEPLLITNYYFYDGSSSLSVFNNVDHSRYREILSSPLGWSHDTGWSGFVSLGDMSSRVAGLVPIEEKEWEKFFNFKLDSSAGYDDRMLGLHEPPDGLTYTSRQNPFGGVMNSDGAVFSYSCVDDGVSAGMLQKGHFCQIWSPVACENDVKRTFVKLSYERGGYDDPMSYVTVGDFGSVLESSGFSLKGAESVELTIPAGSRHSDTYRLQPEPVFGKSRVDVLVPVELMSDLNNDGQITAADNPLRDAAMASGASDAIKDKGTEFIFQDNLMSNGAWDNQDKDGNICFEWPQYGNLDSAPATGEMDDDAIAIKINTPSFGVAWFTHEAIEALSFFTDKECLNAIAIDRDHPFDLATHLPERLWIKFRSNYSDGNPGGSGGAVEGILTLHIGKSTSEEWAKMDLPFTLVPDFGCKKFFEAARNYIFEHNTQVFIWDYKMPDRFNPSQIFRLCVMREEATTAKGYDAFSNNKKGIGAVAVAAGFSKPTVMINGNQCFFRAGYDEIKEPDLVWDLAHMVEKIADGCHGRLIIAGVVAGISSDNFDSTTKPARGSELAGPDPIPVRAIAGNDGILGTSDDMINPMAGSPGGKFFSLSGSTWNFAAGQAIGIDAVGGLSSNYALSVRSDLPHQMVGRAPCSEQGKGCVFTATQIYGVGQAPAFAAAAKQSGNQMLSPSTDVFAQQLFILDSGDGSLALEHIDPVGNLRNAYIGRKSATGFPYYVNNYVQFWAAKPRP